MRRLFRGLLWGLGALVLVVLGLGAWTFGGLAAAIDEPLGAVGEVVKDGYVTLGLLDVGPGQVLLVDAGNDPTGARVSAALAGRGLDPGAVVAVLLTHGHPDHVAAMPIFPQARVFALTAELPYVTGARAYHGPLPRLFGATKSGVKVTDPVEDGARFTIGEREVEVFAIPGHTAGSAAWLVGGVLFLGDSASLTSEGELVGAPWLFSDNTAQNCRELQGLARRLGNRVVHTMVTSHSGSAAGVTALHNFSGC